MTLSRVAPRELILKDFNNLKSQERLFTSDEIEDLILMQSLEGRAHNGSGAFGKMYYVNTSMDDIVVALGLKPQRVRELRQQLIDEVVEYVKDALNGKGKEKLLNKNSKPLLGIPLFKDRIVNPKDILKGLYFGGLRDDHSIRKKTEDLYKINIGYGKCFLVDIEKMNEMGLDAEILAHQPNMDKIEYYKTSGLIIKDEDLAAADSYRYRYFYIRYKVGPGQSDDAAIIFSGLIYNTDVALGVFLSDAIDTLEKYSLCFKDQDDELSYYIKEHDASLAASLDEAYEIAYLAAIPEGREENIPDSSLRYLLTIEPESHISTLENHLNFIEKKLYFPIVISYKKIHATGFYDYIRDRMILTKKKEPIVTFSVFEKEFSKTLGELASKDFFLMQKDISLKEAMGSVISKKSNLIVVQDAEKNVVGVLNANDFLHLLTKRPNNA